MIVKKVLSLCWMLLLPLAACDGDGGSDALSTGSGHSAWNTSDCVQCHSSQRSPALDPVVTNGTGTMGKHYRHVALHGISCQRCHASYPDIAAHMNGRFDSRVAGAAVVAFDALNPSGAWVDDTGQFTGGCTSLTCHGSDVPQWYGTAGWNLPTCTTCHSASTLSRRQVTGANGDFGANTAKASHHVAGTGDPANDQCLVCHDLSTHMGGFVRLKSADSGSMIAYDPAMPSGLEPFCLSCHDADGANGNLSPFSDGSTLGTGRNQAGNRIASYWAGTTAVHKSKGLTCQGTGQPGTGCHGSSHAINAHGSVQNGLLTNDMNFTIPLVPQSVYSADPIGSSYRYDNYKLCFDCHADFPNVSLETVLGYRQGGKYDILRAPTPVYTPAIQSLFRDRYIASQADYPASWSGQNQSYNDAIWGDAVLPLHNYHLLGFQELFGDGNNLLQWKYRGDPSMVGRITCTACHNVHGTGGTIRSTYDEFGLTAYTNGWGDEYKTFLDPRTYQESVFTSYPFNCSKDCHGKQGVTSYWHTPADE